MKLFLLIILILLQGCTNHSYNFKQYEVNVIYLEKCSLSSRLVNFQNYYCNLVVRIKDEPIIVKGNLKKLIDIDPPLYIKCDLSIGECRGEIFAQQP